MLIENKKIYYIDSRNRINGSNSNFSYKLDGITQDDEFDAVAVLALNIPKSYYLIRDGQNYFYLKENNNAPLKISFPIGNYSRRSFSLTIETILTANSPNGYKYEVSYANSAREPETGKLTFTVLQNGSPTNITYISFNFNEYLYENFGFEKNSVNTFSPINSIYTLSSQNVIKLQLEDTIYIHSDICQNQENNNILQEVYCATGEPNFSNIHWELDGDLEPYAKDMVQGKNDVFNFYLTDEENNELDLNGLNWVMTIILYKRQNIFRMIKGYLKYLLYKQ